METYIADQFHSGIKFLLTGTNKTYVSHNYNNKLVPYKFRLDYMNIFCYFVQPKDNAKHLRTCVLNINLHEDMQVG